MAQSSLLVGFLFGVVLLAVVVFLTGRGWRTYSVSAAAIGDTSGGGSPGGDTGRQWASDPTVLSLAFVLVALGFGLVAVLFLGGFGISDSLAQTAGAVLVAGTVGVVVTYLFFGTYQTARSRGLERSQAALAGSWVLGMLFVVAIVLRLLGLF